jgi:hypothetical protein
MVRWFTPPEIFGHGDQPNQYLDVGIDNQTPVAEGIGIGVAIS